MKIIIKHKSKQYYLDLNKRQQFYLESKYPVGTELQLEYFRTEQLSNSLQGIFQVKSNSTVKTSALFYRRRKSSKRTRGGKSFYSLVEMKTI